MAPIEIVKPAAKDPLSELQDAITMQQTHLTSMEAEAAQLGAQLGETSTLSAMLKVRLSEGDASAAAQLDALEREEKDVARKHEGLRLRIVALQLELAPLVRRASELANERDQERQDRAVSDVIVRKEELLAIILESWQHSCESAYELMATLDGGLHNQPPLDEEHRRQVLALNNEIGARLQAAALVHVNEGNQFLFARSEVFSRMRVIPAKRKSSMRAAG